MLVAHPFALGGGKVRLAEDIMKITGADNAIVHNGQVNNTIVESHLKGDYETESDTERLLRLQTEKGTEETLKLIYGTYSIITMTKEGEIIIARSRDGRRPLFIGEKDGKIVAASETYMLESINAINIRECNPGDFYSTEEGWGKVTANNIKKCFFEWNYLSHPLSGNTVITKGELREALGHAMGLENEWEADAIVPIPNSPILAAKGYAQASGIPYVELLEKTEKRRAFLGKTNEERKEIMKKVLNINTSKLNPGSRIVLVEDSIVRGNNLKITVDKVKEMGYKIEGVAIYTPPIGGIEKGKPLGCEYGVDMAPGKDFITTKIGSRNPEDISREFGVPIRFIAIKDLLKQYRKLNINQEGMCIACISPVSANTIYRDIDKDKTKAQLLKVSQE